jgi:Trk-type K+ transport system membrane component
VKITFSKDGFDKYYFLIIFCISCGNRKYSIIIMIIREIVNSIAIKRLYLKKELKLTVYSILKNKKKHV